MHCRGMSVSENYANISGSCSMVACRNIASFTGFPFGSTRPCVLGNVADLDPVFLEISGSGLSECQIPL